MINKKILFIGCGNMGEPVLKAVLEAGANPQNVYVLENSLNQQEKIKNQYQVNTNFSNTPIFDFLILAIKPLQLLDINLDAYNFNKEAILVSILAGTSIEKLRHTTKFTKIARVMPNLPMMIKEGVSSIITDNLSDEEKQLVYKIFSQAGEIIVLKQESDIHASTLLAGSGPGIYYYFCTLMQELAVEYGFSLAESEIMAKQTFIGSAKLLQDTKLSAKEMQQRVSSKGGTTEACINKLHALDLKSILKQGIDAGIARSNNFN